MATASLVSSTALFPKSMLITFQMIFAITTPALIIDALDERMKFSAMLILMGVWSALICALIAHMVRVGNDGRQWDWDTIDFSDGTLMHIKAGVAGLVAYIVLGKCKCFRSADLTPMRAQ